jgi:hypothetical protein
MLLSLAQQIQASEFSAWLAASTWAVPILGALHVLGIAWFGGAVLLSALRPLDKDLRASVSFQWTGGIFMLVSGALLFITEPVRCVTSYSFGAKLILLAVLLATSRMRSKVPASVIVVLWAGVLFASRGIAYF